MSLHRDTKVGELVRHRATRDMYLVTHKTNQGLFVVNVMDRTSPKLVHLILPAQVDEWVRDLEIVDMNDTEATLLEINMDVIESVE